MGSLIERLGRTGVAAVCPHGSPLLMHVEGEVFERQLRWRGASLVALGGRVSASAVVYRDSDRTGKIASVSSSGSRGTS